MQAYLSVSTVGSTKIAGGFRYLDYYSSNRIIHTIGCACCKDGTPAWDNNTQTEDWKMVQQVTNYMKTIFPDDPCRGDFALFGYSINNK